MGGFFLLLLSFLPFSFPSSILLLLVPLQDEKALHCPGIFISTTEQESKHLAAIFKVLNQKQGLQNVVANNIFKVTVLAVLPTDPVKIKPRTVCS